MAKPIKATLTLRGKDAKRFIKEWTKESKNPSPKRIAFLKEAEKHKDFYLKFINDS